MTTKAKLSDHAKSVTKAVTYHTLSGGATFVLAWIVTGELAAAGSLMGVELVAKSFLYYFHERVWTFQFLATLFHDGKNLLS